MATISYGFGGTNVILANGVTQGAQWAPAFASNPAGTRHVGVWTSNAAGTAAIFPGFGRCFNAIGRSRGAAGSVKLLSFTAP